MNAYRFHRPVNTVLNPSPLFARCLKENSNLELDWLWAASEVTHEEERAYCLQRALYINPNSRPAWRGLEALQAPRNPVLKQMPILSLVRRVLGQA
jgi:hypothetical protein